MHRKNAVQMILDKLKGETYLEIGVGEGATFFNIKAKRKIGVDPKIGKKVKIRWVHRLIWGKPLIKKIRLFETTSDNFFSKKVEFLKEKVDVVLIDGLHTYQQSLREVINCLDYLSSKGFIVMHDCNPFSKTIAYPASNIDEARKANLPDGSNINRWCGDVWKTIVYLRSQRTDLHIFTLNCDYGVGIICKGKPENMLNYSAEDIEKMSYQDLKLNREAFLNLKESNYLNKFLDNFKQGGD